MKKVLIYVVYLVISIFCFHSISQAQYVEEIKKGSLLQVIKTGNIEQINRLLPEDINEYLKSGSITKTVQNYEEEYDVFITPLGQAVKENKIEVVEFLLGKGADIDKGYFHYYERKKTPLCIAVSNNNTKMAQYLISKGANIEIECTCYEDKDNEYETTNLMKAISLGNRAIVESLVESGADINKKIGGITSLYIAIINENEDMAKYLISKGADVNTELEITFDKIFPIHTAAYHKNVKILEMLLAKRANINAKDTKGRTPLHHAVEEGLMDNITYLVSKKAEVNAKDNEGQTPLMYVSLHWLREDTDENAIEIAEFLIKKGAKIEARDLYDRTALFYAIQQRRNQIVEFLLDKNAKVNIKDTYNQTPLYYALTNELEDETDCYSQKIKGEWVEKCREAGNKDDIIKLLIAKGAKVDSIIQAVAVGNLNLVKKFVTPDNINLKDSSGKTPLHYAAEKGYREIAEFLISKGATIDITDKKDQTPLILAVRSNNKEIVEILISNGANVNIADYEDLTPLHYVSSKEIAEILLSKGADVNYSSNAPSNNGMTPLFMAVIHRNTELVKLFISKGANVNISHQNCLDDCEPDEDTPLSVAITNGDSEIIKLLEAVGEKDNNAETSSSDNSEIEDYIEDNYIPPSESYELVKAACYGNNQLVKEILEKDASIKNKESFVKELETNHTPLSCALTGTYKEGYTPKHREVVKTLVAFGVDVNQPDPSGQDPMYCTPLQLAVLRNDTQIAHLLVVNGADVNLKIKKGYCYDAMKIAEENKNKAIIALLKAAKVEKELIAASEKSDFEKVKKLLDEDSKKAIQITEDTTVLIWAAKEGHTKLVKALLGMGMKVDERTDNDDTGSTALMYSVSKGHIDVVKLLLDAGADVNIVPTYTYPALISAATEGRKEILKLLLNAGANVNIKDEEGNTALKLAQKAGNEEIVKLLKQAGAKE